jgi:hypothetical protein
MRCSTEVSGWCWWKWNASRSNLLLPQNDRGGIGDERWWLARCRPHQPQNLWRELWLMVSCWLYVWFEPGFTEPVGIGPLRPVPGGTGPARYTNRSGSNPKPCLKFLSPIEPAGLTGLPVGFFNRGNRSSHGFGNPSLSLYKERELAFLLMIVRVVGDPWKK